MAKHKHKHKRKTGTGRAEYAGTPLAGSALVIPPRAGTGTAPATPSSSMALPAVWACVEAITGTVLQVPLAAHTAGEPAALPEWLRKPERYNDHAATLAGLREWLTICQALYGAGYLWADPLGPNAWRLTPLEPDRVVAAFEEHSLGPIKARRRVYSVDGRRVPLARRFTTRSSRAGLLPVPHRTVPGVAAGVGPIQAARLSFGRMAETEAYGSDIYSDGIPAGILTSEQDLTVATATRYKDDWMASAGDPVRVLGNGLTFQHLRLNPKDAAWLDARRYNGEDIARMFLVPAYKLNLAVSGGLTYNNPESLERDFIRGCIANYLGPIESAFNSLTPAGRNASEETAITGDFNGLLRATTAERYSSYAAAIDAGWLTVDEVRAMEGLPPLGAAENPSVEDAAERVPGTAE